MASLQVYVNADKERKAQCIKVLSALNYLEVDENATVWYKREELIKLGLDPKQSRQGRFWTMLETERQLDWEKISAPLGSKV